MQADHIDSKAVLWASVLALMVKNYGRENLNRLAREAKIGPGTATRLKAQETSVGLDTIDKLAGHFNVEAWQLLVPGFEPDNMPVLQPVSPSERRLYERIMAAAKEIATEPDAAYLRRAPKPQA
jgi:hypothetical protein